MSPLALMLAAQVASATALPCSPYQVQVSVAPMPPGGDGASRPGMEVSFRNTGADCLLPSMPAIAVLDIHRRPLPLSRSRDVGRTTETVLLGGGRRASTVLTPSHAPLRSRQRRARAVSVAVRLGLVTRSAPVPASLQDTWSGEAAFEQTPLRAMEGMPSDT